MKITKKIKIQYTVTITKKEFESLNEFDKEYILAKDYVTENTDSYKIDYLDAYDMSEIESIIKGHKCKECGHAIDEDNDNGWCSDCLAMMAFRKVD